MKPHNKAPVKAVYVNHFGGHCSGAVLQYGWGVKEEASRSGDRKRERAELEEDRKYKGGCGGVTHDGGERLKAHGKGKSGAVDRCETNRRVGEPTGGRQIRTHKGAHVPVAEDDGFQLRDRCRIKRGSQGHSREDHGQVGIASGKWDERSRHPQLGAQSVIDGPQDTIRKKRKTSGKESGLLPYRGKEAGLAKATASAMAASVPGYHASGRTSGLVSSSNVEVHSSILTSPFSCQAGGSGNAAIYKAKKQRKPRGTDAIGKEASSTAETQHGIHETAVSDVFGFPSNLQDCPTAVKRRKAKRTICRHVLNIISKTLQENETLRRRLVMCSQNEPIFGWV
ncbi:uncharacterized protein [Ambystoma mexicanum]|uniref:uncharacterized protein n=1 Tax=Ambystoma mexicanum TaxID=8296 RepID=UPI0037E7EBBB